MAGATAPLDRLHPEAGLRRRGVAAVGGRRHDGARLKFSHGTREEHGEGIRRLRALSGPRGARLAILEDLAGPKIRIGQVPGGALELADGQIYHLGLGSLPEGLPAATVAYPEVIRDTAVGVPLLLADGTIELQV